MKMGKIARQKTLTKLLENFKFIADGLTDDPDPAEKGQIRPFSAIQRGRVRAEP